LDWAQKGDKTLETQDEKKSWRRIVKIFCVTCLVCAGDVGFGLRLNTLRSMFNKLSEQPLEELLKVFSGAGPSQFLDSNLFTKIFCFKHTRPQSKGALFSTCTETIHNHVPWLKEETCCHLQEGLKMVVVDHKPCTNFQVLAKCFNQFIPGDIAFDDVRTFAAWWYDNAQHDVFRTLKAVPASHAFDELFAFAKTSTPAPAPAPVSSR